jgi:hypothetical protein
MKVVGKSIFLNPTSSSPKPTVTWLSLLGTFLSRSYLLSSPYWWCSFIILIIARLIWTNAFSYFQDLD